MVCWLLPSFEYRWILVWADIIVGSSIVSKDVNSFIPKMPVFFEFLYEICIVNLEKFKGREFEEKKMLLSSIVTSISKMETETLKA